MTDQTRPNPPAGYNPSSTQPTQPITPAETPLNPAASSPASSTTDAPETTTPLSVSPAAPAAPAATGSTSTSSAGAAPEPPATPQFVAPANSQPRFNTYSGSSAGSSQAGTGYTSAASAGAPSPNFVSSASSAQPGSVNPGTTAGFTSSFASPASKAKNQNLKTFGYAFGGAAVACVLAFAGFSGYNALTGRTSSGSVVIGNTNPAQISTDGSEDRAEAVANKVLPSVVGVDVYTSQGSGFFSSSSSDSYTEAGLGSGVIISSDGYILTNYHVVEGADKVAVTANGESYEAKIVGTDPSSDLAVLKIDATGLTAIEIGSSANINAGEWVMTAGSPFGLEQSVATGIISATSRTVTMDSSSSSPYGSSTSQSASIYPNMIQTDAAINPGNSGGALVDADGKLIGINSVIESYSGNYSGVGFAIPVDYAMNIAQQIIDGKTPTHAQLGVGAVSVNAQTAERYNLGVTEGAYVSAVYEGSGAEAAGMQEGDIITKVNDTAIDSATELIAQVRSHNPGEQVEVTYVRGGETKTTTVTLGSDENSQTSSSSSSSSQEESTPYGSNGSNGSNGYNGWGGSGSSNGYFD